MTRRNFRTRLSLWALVLFLVFMTWLASRGISNESLWYDEIWSMRYAGGMQYGPISLGQTVQRVLDQPQHERNPPAYYLLLNAWGTVAGWTEFSARVLSLFAGLLAIAWTYRLGYDISRDEPALTRIAVGVGAAVTLGASAFFVEYAQDIRAYIFIILLAAMTLALYWRILHTTQRLSWSLQLGFVLAWTLTLFTHYSTLLLCVILGLYHLLLAPKGPRWWRIITLVLLGSVPFLPWGSVLLNASHTAVDLFHTVALQAPQIAQDLTVSFTNNNPAFLILLLIVALQVRGRHARFAWFLAGSGLVCAFLGNLIWPIIINVRYLIVLWPLFALLMGLSMAYLVQHKVSYLPVLGIWIVASVFTSVNLPETPIPQDVRMPWTSMVSVFQQHIQPGDVVLFHSPVTVWFQGPELEHYMHAFSNRYSLTEGIPGYLKDNEYFLNARHFLNNAPRVWLGVDQTMQPNFRLDEFKRAMAADYVHCYTAFDVRQMRLDLYSHTMSSPDIQFGNGVGLKLEEPLQVSANRTLSVLFNTQVDSTVPSDTYSIALHVDDLSGTLRAQDDFGLPADSQSCVMAKLSLPDLPVGNYRLLAVLYNWRTGERVPGSRNGDPSEDRVVLGTFSISPLL